MNDVPRVVDLELWSRPRAACVPYDGKAVAEACRNATGLPREIVLGLNFVPDPTDVTNVTTLLRSRESSQEEFQAFCASQGLEPDPFAESSAARFLVFIAGQALAWLHFPASPEGKPASHLVFQWAEREGFIIVPGQGAQPMSKAELARLWPHDA